ncbi:MAG TPA: PGPGW domain-containing protein [Candidatus Krumholzibacteria bacterium]|nr:PGPGW domain-containing protein [Candidatus Krumholzibacteria bacterium]
MDERVRHTWDLTYRAARRIAVAVIGSTIVLLGVAMLVLPGPGVLTIIGGLAILGLEFAFARRLLQRARKTTRDVARKASDRIR